MSAKLSSNAIQEWNSKLEKLVEKRTLELAKTIARLENTNRKLAQENHYRKAAETALKQQEATLKVALQKEKELHELKARFLTMTAHEFRTPLSSILGAAELIEAYALTEQQPKRQKNIHRIKNAVGTLVSILNDFLALSQLEEQGVTQAPERFGINAFCEEILEELKANLKIGQHIQHKNLDEEVYLFSDKNILKNILSNLISNASKYSDEGSIIACCFDIKNENVLQITVKDNGMGIPASEQPYVFDRFFRAHDVENIQGTGLGLNITKKYVELLGGTIDFESELGKGTRFFVNLPIFLNLFAIPYRSDESKIELQS